MVDFIRNVLNGLDRKVSVFHAACSLLSPSAVANCVDVSVVLFSALLN